MTKLETPMNHQTDADGFWTGSIYSCSQCGYLHRLGSKGPDHGGTQWVLSYALGHRLIDRNAVTKRNAPSVTETPSVTENVTEGVTRNGQSNAERQRAYRERQRQKNPEI